MQRRLAAILAADIAGFTRLVGADEVGTLNRLAALRQDAVEPLIAVHGGQVVKWMGDGLLAEFASVVDAVACALAWQTGAAGRDELLAFRIGISLGDIVVKDGDIYGDGVNLAARLEALAEMRGIAITEDAHRHARGKIAAVFEDMGPQDLKNIAEPVRVFRYRADGGPPDAAIPGTAVSAKPRIAVLPFINLSGDPEQDYFSDGITEDIITELSGLGLLDVIARNSSFAFKGRAVDIREVGRQLGARFVLEGSVRRAGRRVRITAQLIEAETGNHLCAERYDRDLDDLFEVQDDVTRRIVAAMPRHVQTAVSDRAARMRPENMQAYEAVLRARSIRDAFSAEATEEARQLFLRAIDLDPGYARIYSHLADTHFVDFMLGLSDEVTDGRMMALMRQAVRLDEGDAHIQEELGFAYLVDGAWEDAGAQFERAAARAGNHSSVLLWCGYGLSMLGRHDQGLLHIRNAIALDRLHPPYFDWVLGQVLYLSGAHGEAAAVLNAETLLNSLGHVCRVGSYARLGQAEEAAGALAAFKRIRYREFRSRGLAPPAETVQALAGGYRGMWRRQADWEALAEGLRLAGLPDARDDGTA